MRYYFYIIKDRTIVVDEDGLELSTFDDALAEGRKILQDLLNDTGRRELHGGAIQIGGSGGLIFVTLPISPSTSRMTFIA